MAIPSDAARGRPALPWAGKRIKKAPHTGCFLMLERVKGLEPSISAWKANVLPLHYTRILCRNSERLERETGLEPATSALARRRSTK